MEVLGDFFPSTVQVTSCATPFEPATSAVKVYAPPLTTVTVGGLTVTLVTVATGGGELGESSSPNHLQPASKSVASPTMSAGTVKPAMRPNSPVLFM
jgi:hypothetical protein